MMGIDGIKNPILPSSWTKTRVQIWLNEGEDHFFGFWNEFANCPKLKDAYQFDYDFGDVKINDILNTLFEEFNVGGLIGQEATYRVGRNRSLSVGDVVVVGETAWAVMDCGFAMVPTDQFVAAIERGKE